MSEKWWTDETVTVAFLDGLWGNEATVGDDPEVGITVMVRGPDIPEPHSLVLGEQDVLDILAAMNHVRRCRPGFAQIDEPPRVIVTAERVPAAGEGETE